MEKKHNYYLKNKPKSQIVSYAIEIILCVSPAKVQILNCNLLLPFILIDKWEDLRESHYLEKHNVHIEGDQN